ncbi:MAG: TonB-dependent receptor [bacterium]|nr:TonB-dependent receptor [bacterium]
MFNACMGIRWRRASVFSALCVAMTASLADAQSIPNASENEPDSADQWAGVEELVVIGSGTIGALLESTVSATAFDASDLQALGVADISDVAAFTPNLEIRTAGSTTATFFIRGVGLNDFTANAAGSVAIYVDDAPKNLPAIQLGQLFDLEGVEVLKGPQGSGPGRNASAGVIRIVTKKPTGEQSAFLRFDYGNFDYVDMEGALEVPILPDVLAARFAFGMSKRDGFISNRCGGLSPAEINRRLSNFGTVCGGQTTVIRPGLEDKLNDKDSWAARGSLRFQPQWYDDMEWFLIGHAGEIDQVGTGGEHHGANGDDLGSADFVGYRSPEIVAENDEILRSFRLPTPAFCRNQAPNRAVCLAQIAAGRDRAKFLTAQNLADRPLDREPFEGDFNNPGYERMTTYGGLLRGEWVAKDITFTSITGFEMYDRERLLDADYSPNTVFEFDITDDAWQVNQDLRVAGELSDFPIQWESGFFYLQEELDYEQETLSEAAGPIDPLFQSYLQETLSFGVYGDLRWEFLDDFALDGGVRYNWERKTFDAEIATGANAAFDKCLIDPVTGGVPPCKRTETVDHPTGTLALEYSFDEERTMYLKYSHGWKGVQFNARDGRIAQRVTDVASPEKIDAFEIGFDGSWLDGRVGLKGAFFWYAYENYQVFTFTNDARTAAQRIVTNANDARLYGAEAEARLEPIPTLIGEVRFGWLESRFLDFYDSAARALPGEGTVFFQQVLDFNGNPLPNAPRFKISGSVEYTFNLGRSGTLTPRWDFSWSDQIYFDPSEGRGTPSVTGLFFLPQGTIGQNPLLLQNFRLTYSDLDGRLEIAGWVRNLTNELYKTLSFDATGGPGLVGNLVGDPRTYGLSVKLTF